MIIIHHNKDMDGYCSGAICKKRYPEAKLIGWDYKDPVPDLRSLVPANERIILIDITFPLDILIDLSQAYNLIVIDHHISFKKQIDEYIKHNEELPFEYIYEDGVAACEIGWKFLFPDESIPYGVTLIGRYDTWRQKEGDWEGETLPFKYYMYGSCNSAGSFPTLVFNADRAMIAGNVQMGRHIMRYQRTMDEATSRAYSFVREAYGGLRALCLNQPYFSSETTASVYNPKEHDVMIGFAWGGDNWIVSLRSAKDEVDVSLIARSKGGGGHKGAAGFEVKTFEEIFN